jgi:hypothetical protein
VTWLKIIGHNVAIAQSRSTKYDCKTRDFETNEGGIKGIKRMDILKN